MKINEENMKRIKELCYLRSKITCEEKSQKEIKPRSLISKGALIQ